MSAFDTLWRGGKWGGGFGLLGGTACGLVYVVEVMGQSGIPWVALVVRAYSLALFCGLVCGATLELASRKPLGAAIRLVGFVLAGGGAGAFGAFAIATLPNTPFPGPLAGATTIGTAVLGFGLRAVSLATARPLVWCVAPAIAPALLLAPLLAASFDAGGMLTLDALRDDVLRLGLVPLGALAGGLVGGLASLGVSASVSVANLVNAIERRLRGRGRASTEPASDDRAPVRTAAAFSDRPR